MEGVEYQDCQDPFTDHFISIAYFFVMDYPA
jgi:hypothetical protein